MAVLAGTLPSVAADGGMERALGDPSPSVERPGASESGGGLPGRILADVNGEPTLAVPAGGYTGVHLEAREYLRFMHSWHETADSTAAAIIGAERPGILAGQSAASLAPSTYYVAPGGSDSNPGTIGAPFATVMKAHDVVVAGDTIYLRGGTHSAPPGGIHFTRSGALGSRIQLFAYPGETPVLDGSGITTTDTWVLRLRLSASWWHIKGLEIKDSPKGGGITLRDTASNNIIENNNIHHNGKDSAWAASGISVYGSPANNLFLNNDVHHNRDIDDGDADGISAGNTGTGNVYRGNRAWRNSDDGYDFFCVQDGATCAGMVLEDNWSWENGLDDAGQRLGNANGFKLGGTRSGTSGNSGGHTLKNNVAWKHPANGFDENAASREPAHKPNTLYNNTSWQNLGNYSFWLNTPNVFRNNLSFGNLGNITGSDTFNSWTLSVTVNNSDFQSLDDTCARGPRRADGSLPECPFLRLATGSDLIDKGTDVGLPYNGSAPDLGAFEHDPAVPEMSAQLGLVVVAMVALLAVANGTRKRSACEGRTGARAGPDQARGWLYG